MDTSTSFSIEAPGAQRAGVLRSAMGVAAGAVRFVWLWMVGAFACQFLLTSVLAVGWTYRLMRRAAVRRWANAKDGGSGSRAFETLLRQRPELETLRKAPNWALRQNPLTAWRRIRANGAPWRVQASTAAGLPVHSLWLNAKTGFQGLFNTWVMTLPACAIWLFAWHAGWNNSFHKLYEQSHVGILTGLSGVALFIAAMVYVPMAQARQAVSGEWRAFYHFKTVWTLVRSRWMACAALAGLYALVSFPLTVGKVAPAFLPQGNPAFGAMTDADLLAFLEKYYFWLGFAGFAGFVIVRLAAARIYAGALSHAVREGRLGAEDLSPFERDVFEALGKDRAVERPGRSILARASIWLGRRATAVVSLTMIVVFWFVFVAQIFIGEFFHYHPVRAWLNQPLAQAPWFRSIPAHLRDADSAVNAEAARIEPPAGE